MVEGVQWLQRAALAWAAPATEQTVFTSRLNPALGLQQGAQAKKGMAPKSMTGGWRQPGWAHLGRKGAMIPGAQTEPVERPLLEAD